MIALNTNGSEIYLMFKSTVLAFSIFTDCNQIDIIISSFVARKTVTRPNIGIQIELFSECKV